MGLTYDIPVVLSITRNWVIQQKCNASKLTVLFTTKMHPFILILIIATAFNVISGCSDSVTVRNQGPDNGKPQFSDDWIIPKNEVLDGGPGLDGIPSIDNPVFGSINSESLRILSDDRLITGIRVGNVIRGYPHQILDWHEVVNDQVNGEYFAITYCPLTGTDIALKRNAGMEFGVSGLIFRNNLILYDRHFYSRYSQMQIRGVNGPMSGTVVEIIPVIQTSWAVWKEMYPDSEMLLPDTGYKFDYSGYLYGKDYLHGNSATIFPTNRQDNRMERKNRGLGVIEGVPDERAKVTFFPIQSFGNEINLINHSYYNVEAVIAGSTGKNFAIAFQRVLKDGTILEFTPVQDSLPLIMTDQEGNVWDVFGYATGGPRQGERLSSVQAYTGYWFAMADFFPGLSVWLGETN